MKPVRRARTKVVNKIDLESWVNKECVPTLSELIQFANSLLNGGELSWPMVLDGELRMLKLGSQAELPDYDTPLSVSDGEIRYAARGSLTGDRTYTVSGGGLEAQIWVFIKLHTGHAITLTNAFGTWPMPADWQGVLMFSADPTSEYLPLLRFGLSY